MKKGWKVFWIICIAFVILGSVMCGAGIMLGADLSSLGETRTKYHEGSEGKTSKMISKNNIKKIDLDIPVGKVEVRGYDGEDIKWSFENLKQAWSYDIEQEDDTLFIEVEKKTLLGRHFWERNKIGDMILYLPNNMLLDQLNIDMGVGEVCLEKVNAVETSVECGIGEVNYITNESEKEYNIDCSVGIGEAKVGESTYSGFGVKPSNGTQGLKRIKMKCGIGDLKIQFK